MNPSGEVGKASGEETGIGETMEGVVTTVDAMTSAVDAVEAMVMAVEMRDWLEVGRPEPERTTAILFFSRALAVRKRKDAVFGYTDGYDLPLYWPGLLPDLVQLLADCLLPHNSKAIQSGAMLSLKNCLRVPYHRQLLQEITGHAIDPLLRLVHETDSTEIRNLAIRLLGRMAWTGYTENDSDIDSTWVLVFLPLLTNLIHKYAAISEPTDAEISSLNTAIKAITQVHDWLKVSFPQPTWEPDILQIAPVLIGIFQKPGNRKKAQIRVGEFLGNITAVLNGDFLLESGIIGMMLETLRVGKEPTAVLGSAIGALYLFFHFNRSLTEVHVKEVLDMGAMGVFHLVLKRPNDKHKMSTLMCIGMRNMNTDNAEAILKEEGLVETVLNLALGMDLSDETKWHHFWTTDALWRLTRSCSESQMRGLMLKGPLFPVLNRYASTATPQLGSHALL